MAAILKPEQQPGLNSGRWLSGWPLGDSGSRTAEGEGDGGRGQLVLAAVCQQQTQQEQGGPGSAGLWLGPDHRHLVEAGVAPLPMAPCSILGHRAQVQLLCDLTQGEKAGNESALATWP